MKQRSDLLERPERVERFALRSLFGLVILLVAGAGFALLLALVQVGWEPLRELDRSVAGSLNAFVSERPAVVTALDYLTDLGGTHAVTLLLMLTAVWLLVRRQPGLTVYVAVTGIGAWVLSTGLKELVGRARPVVDVPVASAPGMSFPSGHAFGSAVAYGVVLLVFLPVVAPHVRRLFVAGVAALVVLIGFTRVALGVHYVSDVLAGWMLGGAWLAVTAAAFHEWRREARLSLPPLTQGLAPEASPQLQPAPHAAPDVIPDPWRITGTLLAAWVLLLGLLVTAGWLVTEQLQQTWVGRVDRSVVEWFASLRTSSLNRASKIVTALASTAMMTSLTVVVGVVALAVTRRWMPLLLVAAVMLGEVMLFLASSELVGRPRPSVPHLDPTLPPTASFPSGHVSAAIALYGAVTVLMRRWSRPLWGGIALGVAVVVSLLTALSRLYRGVHFPTDVLGSLVLALTWLAVCTWVLRPDRGLQRGDVTASAEDRADRVAAP